MKKILIGLLIVLVAVQFFQIDKTNPVADEKLDFLVMNTTSPEIASQIKASCYDCHSNQSIYPWYASVQPVGWWLKNHIEGGKKHLNFSEFGNYSAKKQAHKMEECYELVEENEMPLSSYTIIHKEAVLDATQKEVLINYFKEIEKGIKK
ncbi:MAG: hypothetical protein ACJAYP_000856 [Flavobacterium sp.]|jgi:hypothetical protein